MTSAADSGTTRTSAYYPMHALDAEFLLVEDERSPMHIGSTCIFEGAPPAQAECEALVAARLSLAPSYRTRVRFLPLGLGRPVWVDDPQFELRHHLHRVALEAPHDDAALYALIGRLMSEPLDRSRPLWQMYVVDGLAGGRWALITKVHHALVDGVAGMTLLAAVLDRPVGAREPAPEPWSPVPAPDARALVGDALRELGEDVRGWGRSARGALKRPRQALRQSVELGSGLLRYARRLVPARRFSLQGPIGGRRRYACARASLEDVRSIRSAFHCTVNDVVLAALSGGYRALLEHRGDDLGRVRLRSLVPVSARAPDAWGILGNRVSAILCELPVRPDDPAARLQQIASDMQRSKRSHMVHAGVWVTDVGDLAPPFLVSAVSRFIVRVMHRHPQRSVATVTTNVPGPVEPLFLLGRRMLEWLPYVPITQGARLGSAVLSYAGRIYFGVTADSESVRDLEVFTRAVEADVKRLLARALVLEAEAELER